MEGFFDFVEWYIDSGNVGEGGYGSIVVIVVCVFEVSMESIVNKVWNCVKESSSNKFFFENIF